MAPSPLIRYRDIQVPRSGIAELVVELRRIGETALAHKLGHAIDHNLDELLLGPNDYGPVLRALAEGSAAGLEEFRETIERQHRRREDEPLESVLAEARQKRLAANEAFFRDINQRLEGGTPESSMAIVVCECADEDCAQRLTLSHAEYAAVRRDPTQFVVAHGHADPEIEELVSRTERFDLVRKLGVGVDVAIRLDDAGERERTAP